MDKKFVIRIISRATLWTAALALVASLAVVPGVSAQERDNQRVTPAQPEQSQPPAMQRPEAIPGEPKAEPEMNAPNGQEMQKQTDQDRDRSRVSQATDNDTTQKQIATFDQFLDKHPEIAEDLQKNPSLVNDKQYVNSHQALEEFLESHPKIREELKENPQAFMAKERRNERREERREERKEEQRPPQL